MSATADMRALAARVRPYLGDGSVVLVGAHVGQTVLRLGTSLIVTRLLAPDAFGVVGIVISVMYVLNMLSDMGLRAYIIRHQTADEHALQTVWTIRLVRAAVLAVIMFLGADAFAQFYDAPNIAGAIRVCSLIFVIEAGSSLSLMQLERDRRVVLLTAIEFVRFLLNSAAMIIAAYYLRSYWAIVLALVVQSAFTLLVSHVVPGPKVALRLQRDHAVDLWRFWRVIVPASAVTIVLTQTNIFVLARFFTLEEVGKYNIAVTLTTAATALAGEFVMRIFFPRFAELNRQDSAAAGRQFYALRRPLTLLLAFGFGGLIGGGELLVRILYNEDYLGAGFYLSLLSVPAVASLSNLAAENALFTRGVVRVALVGNFVRFGWVLTAGPLAFLLIGPSAAIVAVCLAEWAALPYYFWHTARQKMLNLREEAFIFGVAGLGAAIGWSCHEAAKFLVEQSIIPAF